MNGIDANPTAVGPQAAATTGKLALVAANRLALTIILIVAPGIMTLASATKEGLCTFCEKQNAIISQRVQHDDIFYILCHKRVSAVATKVAISLDCWDAINEEVVGVSLSNEFHASWPVAAASATQ